VAVKSTHHIHGTVLRILSGAEYGIAPLCLILRAPRVGSDKFSDGVLYRVNVYDFAQAEEFARSGVKVGDRLHAELECLTSLKDDTIPGETGRILSGPLSLSGLPVATDKRRAPIHHISCEFIGESRSPKRKAMVFLREDSWGTGSQYCLSVEEPLLARLRSKNVSYGSKLIFGAIRLRPGGKRGEEECSLIVGRGIDFYHLSEEPEKPPQRPKTQASISRLAFVKPKRGQSEKEPGECTCAKTFVEETRDFLIKESALPATKGDSHAPIDAPSD
jgi:hypothetical protein